MLKFIIQKIVKGLVVSPLTKQTEALPKVQRSKTKNIYTS